MKKDYSTKRHVEFAATPEETTKCREQNYTKTDCCKEQTDQTDQQFQSKENQHDHLNQHR